MVCGGGLSRDYVATISGGMDKVLFLESIPWVVEAGVREQASLLRALELDAARLAELPDRWTFLPILGAVPTDRSSLLSVRCTGSDATCWSAPGARSANRRPPTASSGRHSCSVASGRGETENTRLPTSICREDFRGRGKVRRGFTDRCAEMVKSSRKRSPGSHTCWPENPLYFQAETPPLFGCEFQDWGKT
jgi:hypothetical protein